MFLRLYYYPHICVQKSLLPSYSTLFAAFRSLRIVNKRTLIGALAKRAHEEAWWAQKKLRKQKQEQQPDASSLSSAGESPKVARAKKGKKGKSKKGAAGQKKQ